MARITPINGRGSPLSHATIQQSQREAYIVSTAPKSGEFPKLDDEYPSPHPLVLLVCLLVSDKPWSVDEIVGNYCTTIATPRELWPNYTRREV
jgi:hypothetical protein